MVNGLFYAVVEQEFGGSTDREAAFLFYGYPTGLEMILVSDASNENSGLPIVTFQSQENIVLPYRPHIYLDSNYDTSLAEFEKAFKGGSTG